ncbi:MAG TPA: tetratricopeptide repeat protein [Caulobacteraceae bacterium]|jgi:TPR repeat protein|nr:tetratricopeptide repeat protein [Caulobacteraceae bacterium]
MKQPRIRLVPFCKRLAQLALLAYAPAAIAAAPASSQAWAEPPVSPDVKAAMDKADAGQPAELIRLADAGRTDAQFYAGVMLIYGRNRVPPDAKKGCGYEQKASSSRADAMHLVGVCWQNGLTGAKDNAKAEAAYLRADQMGFPKSKCALGLMLLGSPAQAGRGVGLCKESANAGDVEAQLVVGDAYFYGRGVKEDHQEARKWYAMAADRNNPQALRRLGEMYAAGDGGKKDTKKAVALWEAAEKAGDPLVCILVADQLFSDLTGGKKPSGGTYAFRGGVPVGDLDAVEAWYQEALQRDPRPDVKQRAQRGIKVVQSLKAAAKAVSVKN